jgi:hypothetical protein
MKRLDANMIALVVYSMAALLFVVLAWLQPPRKD